MHSYCVAGMYHIDSHVYMKHKYSNVRYLKCLQRSITYSKGRILAEHRKPYEKRHVTACIALIRVYVHWNKGHRAQVRSAGNKTGRITGVAPIFSEYGRVMVWWKTNHSVFDGTCDMKRLPAPIKYSDASMCNVFAYKIEVHRHTMLWAHRMIVETSHHLIVATYQAQDDKIVSYV